MIVSATWYIIVLRSLSSIFGLLGVWIVSAWIIPRRCPSTFTSSCCFISRLPNQLLRSLLCQQGSGEMLLFFTFCSDSVLANNSSSFTIQQLLHQPAPKSVASPLASQQSSKSPLSPLFTKSNILSVIICFSCSCFISRSSQISCLSACSISKILNTQSPLYGGISCFSREPSFLFQMYSRTQTFVHLRSCNNAPSARFNSHLLLQITNMCNQIFNIQRLSCSVKFATETLFTLQYQSSLQPLKTGMY